MLRALIGLAFAAALALPAGRPSSPSPGLLTRDVDVGNGVRIHTSSFHHERPSTGAKQS